MIDYHFGLVPQRGYAMAAVCSKAAPNISGWDIQSRSTPQHPVKFDQELWTDMDPIDKPFGQAFVSGSWHVWGEPDDNNSIHVVFRIKSQTPSAERARRLHEFLYARVSMGTRILDYTVITTTEDWSDLIGIAHFIGIPHTVVYRATQTDAAFQNEEEDERTFTPVDSAGV